MIVVVFRARRTDVGLGEEYMTALRRMEELAREMPGYVSHKAYVAQDGERLTLFEWEIGRDAARLGDASRACPDQAAWPRAVLRGLSPSGLRGRA